MLPAFTRSAPAGVFNHSNSGARRELAHGRWKIEVFVIHHKSEGAPACAAPEAMKRLPTWANYERWCFLLMKRAKRLKICPCACEGKIRADHFHDVVRSGDLLDYFRRNRSHVHSIFR